MNIPASAAANAYSLAAKFADPVQAKAMPGAGENGFGKLVSQAMDTIAQSGAETEKVVRDAAVGKAEIVDVVTAVAETELALETLVSVRDKVINSYEQIMRMPI